MPSVAPFSPGNTVSLSATTTTARAAVNLPAGQSLVITNLGPDLAYIAVGTVTVTATTAGFPLLPGTQITITLPLITAYIAGICPTSTATILLTSGDGILNGIGAASTGASGGVTDSVNLAQVGGTAVAIGQAAMAASIPVVIASNQSAVSTSNTTQLPAALGQALAAASLPVVLASDQSTLTTQMAGWSFQNITTSTTTTVKSGAGVLHIVNVNALGTVASTVTVYNNTAGSGTKIATINSLTLSGPFEYDIAFTIGLTIVTTGTQAPDITVSYR